MIIDPEKESPNTIYKILIGSVLPRPIAWVSSMGSDGRTNLAPFSFFTVASSNPPVLCFSPGLKGVVVDGKEAVIPKDTLRNIRQTKEFVVNMVSHSLAERMSQTSGDYPPDVSEFDAVGLTPVASTKVKPPRVGESLINFECVLHQVIEFGDHPGAGNLILGRVVCMHLDDTAYSGGHIDPEVIDSIGRLGGNWYSTIRDRFEIARPQV